MLGHGIRPPKGEVYFPVEGANGELGFYVISDGERTSLPGPVCARPASLSCRPCPGSSIGDMIADLMVPTFGSVNMIGGELDR